MDVSTSVCMNEIVHSFFFMCTKQTTHPWYVVPGKIAIGEIPRHYAYRKGSIVREAITIGIKTE